MRAASLAASVSGCGDSKQPRGAVPFTQAAVQGVIRDDLLGRAAALAPGAVRCSALPSRAGGTAQCTVSLADVDVSYLVTRTARGFSAVPSEPILDVASSAAALRSSLIKDSVDPIDPAVDCGQAKVVQAPPGTETACTVTGAGPLTRTFILAIGPEGVARAEERRVTRP